MSETLDETAKNFIEETAGDSDSDKILVLTALLEAVRTEGRQEGFKEVTENTAKGLEALAKEIRALQPSSEDGT